MAEFSGSHLCHLAEYWRAIGLPYPEGYVERYGNDVYLRKATVEYLGSARYDDVLTVLTRVARFGRTSMTFAFEIHRDAAAPLVTAELVYVNADPATMKPAPWPEDLRSRVDSFEKVKPLT